MKTIETPSTSLPKRDILIHSLEPLWIDYGVFPRLPNPGEDIYCDSLAFRFGAGYETAGVLNHLGRNAGWILQYEESVFQDLVRQQAQIDGISDHIESARQTYPAALAVTAPLRSGIQKTILTLPDAERADLAFLNTYPELTNLVLWGWQPGTELRRALETCQQHNIRVSLALPHHEKEPLDFDSLQILISKNPVIDLLVIYRTPYLPKSEDFMENSVLESLRQDFPLLLVEQGDIFQLRSKNEEIELVFRQQKNSPVQSPLAFWTAVLLNGRALGMD